MRKAICIVILCVGLFGCTVDDLVPRETADQLDNEDTNVLFSVYHATHDTKVKAAIIRRKIIPDQDWALIDQYQVAVGMYNYEVIAAWGDPDDIRNRTTQAGTKSKFVYNDCRGCHKTYLIFDTDGVLTTIVN
jgi:hypothetical protein